MTSKEKALELINKFSNEVGHMSNNLNDAIGKEMALICADEIIDQWEYIDTYISDLGGKLNPNLKYWLEVKEELLKL